MPVRKDSGRIFGASHRQQIFDILKTDDSAVRRASRERRGVPASMDAPLSRWKKCPDFGLPRLIETPFH